MAVGVQGSLTPVKGPATPFTFTEVEPERGFVDVSRLPFTRMTFEHRILPTKDGCRFTHRVTISGLLSSLFARVIGRNVSAGLPTAMQALARLAEKASAPA